MIKKLLIFTIAILIIGVGSLLYLVVPYLAAPKFIVKNESGVSVEVTAYWKEESKRIGSIVAGRERVFEVNDEAAMEFRVVYPSGQVVTSPAVYFTSGTSVIAVITGSDVEVSIGSEENT